MGSTVCLEREGNRKMARVCDICGKSVASGRKYARRGKAKYLGGVGRRITGKSLRKFRPNLQKVRASVNGGVKRVKVCAACIRSGKVSKVG